MSDETFIDRTEWISITRPLPDGWTRDVKNVAEYVLGRDLRLRVQSVVVCDPHGGINIVKGEGTTVELFDSSDNHLATVAAAARRSQPIDVSAIVAVIPSWPWTAEYINVPGSDLPFGGRE